MEEEMRDLRARLEDMETTQRHTVSAGDLSDSEIQIEARHEGEEVAAEDVSNECLIRAIARMGAKEKMDIPVYEGNLDAEELLDWIGALETYFDYEDVEEDKVGRFASMPEEYTHFPSEACPRLDDPIDTLMRSHDNRNEEIARKRMCS
jgi:hypothetical protein